MPGQPGGRAGQGPHLGQQVATQPGVGGRAAGHVWQKRDVALYLMEYRIGVGQCRLVLWAELLPWPQHAVQLLLHPAYGAVVSMLRGTLSGRGGDGHLVHRASPCTPWCWAISRMAHCSVAEVVSVPAMIMSSVHATALSSANRPWESSLCRDGQDGLAGVGVPVSWVPPWKGSKLGAPPHPRHLAHLCLLHQRVRVTVGRAWPRPRGPPSLQQGPQDVTDLLDLAQERPVQL